MLNVDRTHSHQSMWNENEKKEMTAGTTNKSRGEATRAAGWSEAPFTILSEGESHHAGSHSEYHCTKIWNRVERHVVYS